MSNFLQDCLVYRDEDILVIQKPEGLLSVPGKGEALFDSVLTRLHAIEPKTLLIHRLDRDTSGLLVFALNKAAQSHISRQFQERQTYKLYQAIVEGDLPERGEVNVPVCYDPSRPPLHIADPNFSKPALTQFEVIEYLTIQNQKVSRVALTPITGRSHQLRVHMQYLGHPIIGDTLYATVDGQTLSSRLCLHATALSFKHPVSGQALKFVCPPPF
ncbi:RluA family pseudouridine synthase [Acinetobacter qingfengensis]|uniref:Dual-specificity RNA pseudouridine synthase RluA n=1 Tax=Acinetobacter qingfengensis TaxID=1262585 RepID=A0A1E7R5N6_9GAMM|nr:RluA family pseudouridine synthase [Acinetobacter qingfengensis]KAA8735593.1 RluA family pseudouridine synthase [Acinetobacter qingfengensis]OEY94640.1 RNA pseudouridine synthase [Acinetobacter qingfengensis]